MNDTPQCCILVDLKTAYILHINSRHLCPLLSLRGDSLFTCHNTFTCKYMYMYNYGHTGLRVDGRAPALHCTLYLSPSPRPSGL